MNLIVTISISIQCHYAECRYAECHVLFIVKLNCYCADCNFVECHCAECDYAEFRGTIFSGAHYILRLHKMCCSTDCEIRMFMSFKEV
jgi:hypothetical protein